MDFNGGTTSPAKLRGLSKFIMDEDDNNNNDREDGYANNAIIDYDDND